MVEDPNLFLFGCFLWLGVTLLILLLLNSNTQNSTYPQDDEVWREILLNRLRKRRHQLGIPTWEALRTKSGLTSYELQLVCRGEIGQLKISQLRKLATALDWSLEELIHNIDHQSILLAAKSHISNLVKVTTEASQLKQLQQQCFRLRKELQHQSRQLNANFQKSTFEQLQTLLTNYPSASKMAQAKPDLPAKNLTSLFTPLENLLQNWGYEPIGKPWEQVPYNPQLHQPDTDDIKEGELVYVRFIGYRDRNSNDYHTAKTTSDIQPTKILCPAKVSRTLPGGVKN
ncbi:MAG: helix-turn-helix domain-containing protein [Symploca sp. SIO2G7]|nr:helix-turn-helix domain-containing protein [Symploca sp. SIO2G7]